MVGVFGTHAPTPHNEFICHATGEKRQNIINEIKMLLEKVDDRPCIVPEIRPENKQRPIIGYPGYVDRRHPAFKPPEHPPLISNTGVAETRYTSEPGRVADDPPDVCYKVRTLQQQQQALGSSKNVKAVEIRGGTALQGCECVKRNGMQDQCQRRECNGRPECLAVNPGPCCPPAMALTPDIKAVDVPQKQIELCKRGKGYAVCCCCHEC